MQLSCDFKVPEGLLRRRVTQWKWDLARGGNFPFTRLVFQWVVWGLVVKYSTIFMDLTKDTRRFFPYKEHVRLFRSSKFFRPLTVRSMRLLFVVAAAAYAMAICLLLGLPPEMLQYLQVISQTWANEEDSKQRNILHITWNTWHLACLDDEKQI